MHMIYIYIYIYICICIYIYSYIYIHKSPSSISVFVHEPARIRRSTVQTRGLADDDLLPVCAPRCLQTTAPAIKSPSSMSLICTGTRQNPAICSADQGSQNRRFAPSRRAVDGPRPGNCAIIESSPHASLPEGNPSTKLETELCLDSKRFLARSDSGNCLPLFD